MSRAVAIGDERLLAGYALAGAEVLGGDPLAAFESLADDVGLLVLSPAAAAVLERVLPSRPDLLTVVVPS